MWSPVFIPRAGVDTHCGHLWLTPPGSWACLATCPAGPEQGLWEQVEQHAGPAPWGPLCRIYHRAPPPVLWHSEASEGRACLTLLPTTWGPASGAECSRLFKDTSLQLGLCRMHGQHEIRRPVFKRFPKPQVPKGPKTLRSEFPDAVF